MILLNFDRSTDDGSGLHHGDFREGNRQTAAAVSHHRIEFYQSCDDVLDLLYGLALRLGNLLDLILSLGYEFMKRRIQETDGHRISFHRF